MTESENPTTNIEESPPPSKGWLIDSLERNANAAARLAIIQERNQLFQARHDRIQKRFSTALITVFTAAAVFALGVGCLALWNAVVG